MRIRFSRRTPFHLIQVLWLCNIYTLGGGYTVLQIAMYGYIGDVTNQRNRTTLMALLSGIGILVFPAAEAAGGQIYKYLGRHTIAKPC